LHIETCERLCKEFAGTFIRVRNSHALEAIVETSRSYRITQIVMGESQKSRWQILFKGSLTQRILRLLKNVDIHIISTSKIQD
jgi:two-component system sensor histidine kinase KdpD